MQASTNTLLSRRNNRHGFTIVELLIVIVVIGILAAITIVAYNGIQQRARNAKTTAAAKAYLNAFQIYVAQNGSYPNVGYNNYCLGQPVASCSSTGSSWSQDAGLETALKTVITPLPLPSNGPGTANTVDANLGYIPPRGVSSAGPMFNGTNSPFLYYILEGDTSCTAGSVASGSWPNFSSTPPAGGRTYTYPNNPGGVVSVCIVPLLAV